jgi:excinuclease ABC subunit C
MNWTTTEDLPRGPGVYIFKDIRDTLLYIGMATNLRNRVRSYARQDGLEGLNESELKKIQLIQARAVQVDHILADNVLGAKIMEDYLIFHFRPPLNGVMLPINYNYLKITCQEAFPRLLHTKDIQNDGGVYFGPFHSFSRSKDVVFDLRRIFKLRTCDGPEPGQKRSDKEPSCLNHAAGHCLGPCQTDDEGRKTLREEYAKNVTLLLRVLEGDLVPLNERLIAKMQKAADELDFETAALYKKKQDHISHALNRKKMKLIGPGDLQKILERVEAYISQHANPFHSRAGYSRWE